MDVKVGNPNVPRRRDSKQGEIRTGVLRETMLPGETVSLDMTSLHQCLHLGPSARNVSITQSRGMDEVEIDIRQAELMYNVYEV